MKRLRTFLLIASLFLPSVAAGDMLVGGEVSYPTKKGDCLVLIGAKEGLDWEIIAKENRIEAKNQCRINVQLTFTNRKIVPRVVEDGIIVNIPDRMLYFFKEGTLVSYFPVCLGSRDWPTPLGTFVIMRKEHDPTWHVPKSIQREMKEKHQTVKEVVPPGPDNPLGRFALETSLSGILIHETIWPTTIYQWRSHGCIRVMPENMEGGFFDLVERGTKGEVIYQPVSVAMTEEGRVFLQVDRDIYRMVKSLDEEARGQIERRGLSDKVDWTKVEGVVKAKSGIAVDVSP